MTKKLKFKNMFITVISSVFLLYTLTLLDFLSIGTKLYRKESHGENLETFNMIVFTTSCIASQFVFGGFSKFKAGICGGPIFESTDITKNIHDICEKNTDTATDSVTNAYFAIMISTLLFALISFLAGVYNLGKYFQFIPKMALFGVMASIGIELCKAGFLEIYITDSMDLYMHFSFVLTILLVLFAYFLEKKFPGYVFFIPLYSLMIITAFYLVSFILKCDNDWLRSKNFIPDSSTITISLDKWTKYLSISSIRFDIFLKCLPRIFDLAFTNMIHITVNVSGFSSIMNIPANINEEFKTQGYANFLTGLFGFPTYFINCTSFYFNKSGGTTRFHALIGGVFLIGLIYIGPTARNFLPRILLAFIPIYIGGAFIISNIIDNLGVVSTMDLSIILASCISGYFISPVMGLSFGSLLSEFIILFSYSKWINRKDFDNEKYYGNVQKNYEIIKIDFIAFFMTLDKLKEKLEIKNEKVIIDLRMCPYLDSEANNILNEYIMKNDKEVLIIGNPDNLYTKRFSKYMI